MAIFSTILGLLRTVGKPVANAINGIIQSLDADGNERVRAINQMRMGSGFSLAIPGMNPSSSLVKGHRGPAVTLLGESTDEESDLSAAVVSAQHARDMNVMLNEIPFFDMDEYTVELRQSYAIAVPQNSSCVATIFLSPIMNLGGILTHLAKEYALMRVDGVFLECSQQNQLYSTVDLAYNPILARGDLTEMATDLEGFYDDGNPALGFRVLYYTASPNQQPGVVTINGTNYNQHRFEEYTRFLNAIKRSKASYRASELPDSTLAIAQPGFRECPMRTDESVSPVYIAGMNYISLEYAADFIGENGTHMQLNQVGSTMPVYGKFHYCVSNTYTEPVDQIVTIKYQVTCKSFRDGSTYMNPNGEPYI